MFTEHHTYAGVNVTRKLTLMQSDFTAPNYNHCTACRSHTHKLQTLRTLSDQ